MKVNKAEFLKALQLVSKAVNPRPIIPLLGSILFEYEEDNIRLSATNYELSIKTNLGASGKGSFSAAIPTELVTSFITLAQDEQIEISFDEKSYEMTFKTETSKNKVNCINPEEFPAMSLQKGKGIILPVKQFCTVVERVSFAASSQAGLLNGVQIVSDNGKLIMFATNGIHLSYEETEINKKYKDFPLNVIIPSGSLNTIAKILDIDSDMIISVTDNQVFFQCNKTDIVCQQLSGKFPDYKLLKAAKPTTIIRIETDVLLRSCKQMELFCEDTGNVKVTIKDLPLIELFTSSKERGNSVINLPCKKDGKPLVIGVNVTLVKQFLEVCSTEYTIIKFTDPKSFIVFELDDYKDYYHIIMPMAV